MEKVKTCPLSLALAMPTAEGTYLSLFRWLWGPGDTVCLPSNNRLQLSHFRSGIWPVSVCTRTCTYTLLPVPVCACAHALTHYDLCLCARTHLCLHRQFVEHCCWDLSYYYVLLYVLLLKVSSLEEWSDNRTVLKKMQQISDVDYQKCSISSQFK